MSRITEGHLVRHYQGLDACERRWAECNERDLYDVETTLAEMEREDGDG